MIALYAFSLFIIGVLAYRYVRRLKIRAELLRKVVGRED